MTARIEARWRWKTRGPLHCGSGLSRPGYADRLVSRDADERPYIPATAVKGALRMSAEQLATWLGVPQTYRSTTDGRAANVEPRSVAMAALFGGDASVRYQAGTLATGADADCRVVASTAILDRTGVARDDTLRLVEIVSGGVTFHVACSVVVDEALAGPVADLLAAAIAATENVGSKAGVGWGRVDIAEFTLTVDGVPRPAPGEKKLSALRELLQPNGVAERSCAMPKGVRGTSRPLEWRRLEITLHEPLCIGRRPRVSNALETLEMIPATSLRGALQQAWLEAGRDETEVASWLGEATRWGPALPCAGNGRVTVPTPRSYQLVKGETPLGGSARAPHGLHDVLAFGPAPHESSEHRPVPWRACRVAQMVIAAAQGERAETDQAPELRPVELPKRTSMHVARDYTTGAKRSGALFTRTTISPRDNEGRTVRFTAFARLPDSVPTDAVDIRMGQRRSAGHGAATVRYERLDALPASIGGRHGTEGDPDVYVQLTSPALMRGARGGWRRTLTPQDWVLEAGLQPEAILDTDGHAVRSAARTVWGWLGNWGHARAGVTAVDEGSVWKLRCRDAPAAQALRGALARLREEGLGERVHEGFGWFVVDPSWLGVFKGVADAASPTPEPPRCPEFGRGHYRVWPGTEGLESGVCERIVAAVRGVADGKLGPGIAAPLQELLRQVRDGQRTRVQALGFVQTMDDAKRWRALGTVLDQVKDEATSEEGFRFLLQTLLVRAREERR